MAWVTPIWDRTAQDIIDKTAKGYYNFEDFNRIEGNCTELASLLGLTIITKTDWAMGDFPTDSEMERILQNVEALRAAYHTYDNCPQNPQHPVNSFQKANAIERIMDDIYTIFDINKDNFYYAGEIYAGETEVI